MESIFFIIFATITVISAILVISFRNTLSSALSLVVCLFGMACLYAMLEAHFLAIMQILVYAGAVMVLFIFVIMLMNLGKEELLKIKMSFAGVIGILVGGYLATILFLKLRNFSQQLPAAPEGFGDIKSVGLLLFSDYLIHFEAVSFLLLVAIVGVIIMARKGDA